MVSSGGSVHLNVGSQPKPKTQRKVPPNAQERLYALERQIRILQEESYQQYQSLSEKMDLQYQSLNHKLKKILEAVGTAPHAAPINLQTKVPSTHKGKKPLTRAVADPVSDPDHEVLTDRLKRMSTQKVTEGEPSRKRKAETLIESLLEKAGNMNKKMKMADPIKQKQGQGDPPTQNPTVPHGRTKMAVSRPKRSPTKKVWPRTILETTKESDHCPKNAPKAVEEPPVVQKEVVEPVLKSEKEASPVQEPSPVIAHVEEKKQEEPSKDPPKMPSVTPVEQCVPRTMQSKEEPKEAYVKKEPKCFHRPVMLETGCFFCGTVGHMTESCPYGGRVCFLCHSEGHLKKDCPFGKYAKF